MRPLRPKLLEIYSDWTRPRGWVGQNWGELIHAKYTPHTLSRMLGASSPATRCSAAWALGIVGDITQLGALGPLLSDSYKRVRTAANDARRMIQSRTLSPWHRQCAQQIEAMLAADQLSLACDLADDLVEETQCRSDAFMLRAGVRFCNRQLVRAIEDFRSTLAIDPYSYRACIAMGQCYWHLHLDSAARECFLEAARIYPDWTPAYRSLKLLPPSSAVA